MEALRQLWISSRPQQWIKNTFVFLPVLFAQRLFDRAAWWTATLAFGVFCLAASGIYLWNDVADRAADRVHPLKRRRPVAAGTLSVSAALTAAVLCLGGAITAAYQLRPYFSTVVACYVVGNLLYTRWLRALVIVDVFCLAAFLVLRIVGGLVVLDVTFSYWMLILTALLALFLALNKRRYELVKLAARARAHRGVLAKYSPYFIDQMCAAITAAVMVVYILFTLDPREVAKFNSHNLVFSIPFVCYGVFRYQYLVFKRGRGGDPARIIWSDKVMLADVLLWAVVCGLAIYARQEWLPWPLE